MTAGMPPIDDGGTYAAVVMYEAEVTPGQPILAPMTVTNLTAAPRRFALQVVGFEPTWVQFPEVIGPLAPGQTATVGLRVELPVGHPASRLVGSMTVRPVDDASGVVLPHPVAADLVLHVGDGNMVRAELDPKEVPGRSRGRFAVILQNRGKEPVRVALSPVVPDDTMTMDFLSPSPVLAPGAEVRVQGTVGAPRPFTGQRVRRPFGVRIQGRGTPVLVEGSMLQRPFVSSGLLRAGVWAMVLLLWASVAVVGATALNRQVKKSANAQAVAQQPPTPAAADPAAGTSPGGSGGSGGASGGSSGGSSSSSGSGGATSGGGGSPTSTSSTFSGTVSGASPAGASVSVVSTPLVPPSELQSATTTGTVVHGPIGKDTAEFVDNVTSLPGTAAATPTFATTSGAGGFWTIPSIPAPGDYLVTIAEPGFTTQKYVVTTSIGGGPIKVDAKLMAGSGTVSGTVRDSSGKPLGGVDVSVTDGTVTLVTKTPTTGDVGTYRITGLSTPDTYDVQATLAGYGAETTLVNLGAAGTRTGVDLRMKPGVASIYGTVTSSTHTTGIGGITVTATSGKTTVTSTTNTVAPIGHFNLPNLPMDLPAGTNYTVTVSGTGWITATERVTITGDLQLDPSLMTSSADVLGSVTGPTCKGGAPTAGAPGGLGGIGIVLASPSNTYKTLSASAIQPGSYDFGSIPPGQYVLTAEAHDYVSQSVDVTVGSGSMSAPALTLACAPLTSLATASITGTVRTLAETDNGLGGFVDGATVTLSPCPTKLDDSGKCPVSTQVVTRGTGTPGTPTVGVDGTYTFPNVQPGIYVVTASGTPGSVPPNGNAADYGSSSASVTVPLGAVVTAPPILLPQLDELDLQFTSPVGHVAALPTVSLSRNGAPFTPTVTSDLTTGTIKLTQLPAGTYTVTLGGSVCTSSGVPLVGPPGKVVPAESSSTSGCLYAAVSPITEILGIEDPPKTAYIGLSLQALTVEAVDADGAVLPGVGVDLFQCPDPTVTCVGPTLGPLAGSATTGADGIATIGGSSGLVLGDHYLAEFLPPAGSPNLAAPPLVYQAGPNTSTQFVHLTPKLADPTITLEFPYVTHVGTKQCRLTDDGYSLGAAGGGATCPGLPTAPSVQLHATFAVSGQTGTFSRTITAATPTCPTPAPAATDPCHTYSYTFTASDLQGLLPQQSTITVTDGSGAFQQPNPVSVTPSTLSWDQSISLHPYPVGVTGSLQSVGTTPVGTGVTATVTPAGPQATVAAGGAISWNDPSIGQSGVAEPGEYQVAFNVPGFDNPPTVDMTAPLLNSTLGGGGTCTVAHCVVLSPSPVAAHYSLTFAPQFVRSTALGGTTPYAVDPAHPDLPAATVTLESQAPGSGAWAPVEGPRTVPLPTTAGTDATVKFSTPLSPSTTYEVVIGSPGFDQCAGTSPGGTCTGTQSGTTQVSGTLDANSTAWVLQRPTGGSTAVTFEPTLTLGGYITGTTEGVINTTATPMAGDTVAACPQPNPGKTCTPSSSGALTGVSDANGTFVVTGGATSVHGGLVAGTTYDVAIVGTPGSGYPVPSPVHATAVDVTASGPNPQTTPLVLSVAAQKIRLSITVDKLVNGVAKPAMDATVTATSPSGTTVAPTPCPGTCTLSIDPTIYSFAVTEPGYGEQDQNSIAFTPGGPVVPLKFLMSHDVNNFAGQVTLSGTSTGLNGATVDLYSLAGSSPVLVATTTTATDANGKAGAYTITTPSVASGLTFFANGNYSIAVTLPGYTMDNPNPISFKTLPPTTYTNATMTPSLVPLDVVVSSAVGGALPPADVPDFRQAPVTITPTAQATSSCPGAAIVGVGVRQVQPVQSQVGTGTQYAGFFNVAPGHYQVTIDLSSLSVSHPDQSHNVVGVDVCPNATPSTPQQAQFSVAEGAVYGSATASGANAPVVVSVQQTGTSAQQQGVEPTALSTGYLFFVTQGSTYTVTATATGYTLAPVSTGAITATPFHHDLAMKPDDQSVSVTVLKDYGANGAGPAKGASVSLVPLTSPLPQSDPVPAPQQTDSTGTATFVADVPPGTYRVQWDGVAVTGSGTDIVVPVRNPTGAVPIAPTVTVPTAVISATVTNSTASTDAGTLLVCSAPGCAVPVLSIPATLPPSPGSVVTPIDVPAAGSFFLEWRNAAGTVTATSPVLSLQDKSTTSVPLTDT